jgi:acyl-CoA reductase-like NAD-dependent aldehyde dehydrogenase
MTTTVVVDPSTNQPITAISRHSPDDVDRAVQRAEAKRLLGQSRTRPRMSARRGGLFRKLYVEPVDPDLGNSSPTA